MFQIYIILALTTLLTPRRVVEEHRGDLLTSRAEVRRHPQHQQGEETCWTHSSAVEDLADAVSVLCVHTLISNIPTILRSPPYSGTHWEMLMFRHCSSGMFWWTLWCCQSQIWSLDDDDDDDEDTKLSGTLSRIGMFVMMYLEIKGQTCLLPCLIPSFLQWRLFDPLKNSRYPENSRPDWPETALCTGKSKTRENHC